MSEQSEPDYDFTMPIFDRGKIIIGHEPTTEAECNACFPHIPSDLAPLFIGPDRLSIQVYAWESDLFEPRFAKKVRDLDLSIHIAKTMTYEERDEARGLPDFQVSVNITGSIDSIKKIIRWIQTCTTWF